MNQILTIPNIITIIRLFLTLSLFFFINHPKIPFIIVLVVLISDLEGVLARKLNQITKFGTVLDKLVDFLLVLICLIFFFDNWILIVLFVLSRFIKNLIVKTNIKDQKPFLFSKLTFTFACFVILAQLWGFEALFMLKWVVLVFWLDTFYVIFRTRF